MRIFERKGKVVPAGQPLEADGIAYPWNWFDLASPDDLRVHGFTVREAADPTPPTRQVRKSIIISRLTDEQLGQALGLLTVRQQERWRAPDRPAVNADDPETIQVLLAVGADPAVVLAPE